MQFKFRSYQLSKTKQRLKKKFLLLSNGANQSSKSWITVEQVLKNSKLNYYKIYNKVALKVLKNSRYKNIFQIIRGTFFFLELNKSIALTTTKNTIFNSLENIFFFLLAIKVNNKIYSVVQIKNLKSFIYKTNIVLLYHFFLVNLKYIGLTKVTNKF